MAKRTQGRKAASEKSEMPGFIKPQLATLKPRRRAATSGFMKSSL
jgi:hypothetical protein